MSQHRLRCALGHRALWPVEDRDGFVMVMAVLLLLAVSVAGATGYQLVRIEADLSSGAEEAQEALAAARAGLERYVGEHIGVPGDTATYVVGDADVTVTQERLANVDDETDMYLLEAVGEVVDLRYPGSPARRTVRQYARLHKMPVNPVAAAMAIAYQFDINSGSVVHGNDYCGSDDVHGIANTGYLDDDGGSLNGLNPQQFDVGNAAAFFDSVAVRWDVLADPNFPIPFDGDWPDFSGIPLDSFPVVRVNGNLNAGNSRDGRGLLIVTGALTVSSGFDWDGIILAGSSPHLRLSSGYADVNGMVVIGLDGSPQAELELDNTRIRFCYDYVRDANRSIAYLELVDDSRLEF